ncbi:MAG: TlpA family protein disulfide reductase [Firmicutes bacterium]|nr:TlpA family protein disulfide reductase [Bacillota bacterium]
MKKTVSALLALLLLLALASCGEEKPSAAAPETTAPAQTAAKSEALAFSTTDLAGEAVDETVMSEASVVMINFWEPWCSPCVSEMPELEKLYQAYREDGFLILGVFSTKDADSDSQAVIDKLGITYPILHASEELQKYMTNYVPTTVFFDGDGNLLSQEPIVGARDYGSWETLLREYLNGEQ